jgi:hypothetical protein
MVTPRIGTQGIEPPPGRPRRRWIESPPGHTRRGSRLRRSGAILLAIGALPIAGCGGSSSSSTGPGGSSPSSTSATGTPVAGAARGALDGAAGRHASGPIQADVVHTGTAVQHPKRGTGGSEVNDDNPGRADSGGGTASGQLNPCTLVSRAQAQAMIGHRIEDPQEAPLGPSCIYQPVSAKSFVTMTVEAIDLSKIAPQIKHRKQLIVAGHTAYCGDYGQPTTFVAVGHGRVLSITAPCALGSQFAAAAVPRVPSL